MEGVWKEVWRDPERFVAFFVCMHLLHGFLLHGKIEIIFSAQSVIRSHAQFVGFCVIRTFVAVAILLLVAKDIQQFTKHEKKLILW